jgi:hypothetical protein
LWLAKHITFLPSLDAGPGLLGERDIESFCAFFVQLLFQLSRVPRAIPIFYRLLKK